MPLVDPNRTFVLALGRLVRNSKGYLYRFLRKELPLDRPKLVVLGTGWSSFNLIRQIDPSRYNVTIVSPRPHFVYTPLLTCALSGTLSLRSVIEPIRPYLNWGGRPAMTYVKATATEVDLANKIVHAKDESGAPLAFPFQKLAVGVGAVTNTFGIPGVKEHSTFLKEASDVDRIRETLFDRYNAVANSPKETAEEAQLLNVVIVGGGPAGVEAAAEINDLMKGEFQQYFNKRGTVTLIEMLPTLLPMFGPRIADWTTRVMLKQGVKALTEHRVERVDAQNVYAVNVKTKESVKIPYGQLIWASGVGPTELVKKLLSQVQPQNRVLKVRPDLSVVGARDVYAMGDCVIVEPPKLAEKAISWERAGVSPTVWLRKMRRQLISENYVQLSSRYWAPMSTTKDMAALLKEIDAAYKPPIATGQMARRAGSYLGFSFNQMSRNRRLWPYIPADGGAMAYVGNHQAVLKINLLKRRAAPPQWIRLGGFGSNAMFQAYYLLNQSSIYNQVVSLADLTRSKFATRDLTEAPAAAPA